MPIAKYKKEKREGRDLYYTYEKTGLYDANGKPTYKKLRASTIAALDEKVRKYRESSAFCVEPSSVTVNEWYNTWFTSYKSKCRQTTRNFYESLYNNHIRSALGSMRLTQVREFNCQKLLNDMSAEYSMATVAKVRSVMYDMFAKAQSNNLIAANPAASLSKGGKPKVSRRALTLDERRRYLKACETHPFGTFALFLYFFGLRRGECLALTGQDLRSTELIVNKQFVYPGNNQPILALPKTDAGRRSIPVPEKFRRYVDIDSLPDGLLFANEDGSPLSYSQVIRRWDSFISYALGPETEVTMHYIRHNYSTMLFEQNVDLMSCARYCGHEDIKTTLEMYTHYTESLKQNSSDRILAIG